MRRTNLPGHALIGEGMPHWIGADGEPYRLGPGTGGKGRALCECGEVSPQMNSGGQRRRWHRDEHKPAVRAQMEAGRDQRP